MVTQKSLGKTHTFNQETREHNMKSQWSWLRHDGAVERATQKKSTACLRRISSCSVNSVISSVCVKFNQSPLLDKLRSLVKISPSFSLYSAITYLKKEKEKERIRKVGNNSQLLSIKSAVSQILDLSKEKMF